VTDNELLESRGFKTTARWVDLKDLRVGDEFIEVNDGFIEDAEVDSVYVAQVVEVDPKGLYFQCHHYPSEMRTRMEGNFRVLVIYREP